MSSPHRLIAVMHRTLHYNAETGEWIRIASRRTDRIGQPAGSPDSDGYLQIKVNGRLYLAHRLSFLWMTGKWPPDHVDHVNGMTLDNRWANLRPATRRQNTANSRRRSDNLSGFKGVRLHSQSRRWQARIGGVSLGLFNSREEAHIAYCKAASSAFGEYARG